MVARHFLRMSSSFVRLLMMSVRLPPASSETAIRLRALRKSFFPFKYSSKDPILVDFLDRMKVLSPLSATGLMATGSKQP